MRRSASRLGVPVPSRQRLARRSEQVVLMVQAVTDRARAEWRAGYPVVLRHLQERFPSLPLGSLSDADAEPDPVELVMEEFDRLEPEQQDKVAKNLALLWNSFTGAFGGVSGFQAASPTEQQSYVEKLEAAARRMEAARGTEAAFHYVTVELIRQYIAFLQVGSTEQRAVALARRVAPLIDRGYKMEAQPFLHTVGSRR
ncbi:hypothetical protein [Microvirga subterranea]|nr:hypothetical protein [Microvirga subterranea]